MPASPFGLAYGIGAGLSGIPGAIQQGAQDKIAMSLRSLQLKNAQDEAKRVQSERDIMAQPDQAAPVQPPETVTTPGMPAATDLQGNPMTTAPAAPGGVTTPGNYGEALPSLTPPTTKQIIPLQVPEHDRANALLQKAQQFKQIGSWQTGLKLEQMAHEQGQAGTQKIRSYFAEAVDNQDFDKALSAIHGLGFNNVVGLTPAADGGIEAQKNDGTSTYMSPTVLLKMKDPDIKPEVLQQMMLRDTAAKLAERRQEQAEAASGQASHEKELDRKLRRDLANIASSRTGSATTADKRNVEAYMKATGVTEAEAWDRIRPSLADRGRVTDKNRTDLAAKINAAIEKRYGGPPMETDPEYKTYQQNEGIIGEALVRRGAPGGAVPPPPPGAKVL